MYLQYYLVLPKQVLKFALSDDCQDLGYHLIWLYYTYILVIPWCCIRYQATMRYKLVSMYVESTHRGLYYTITLYYYCYSSFRSVLALPHLDTSLPTICTSHSCTRCFCVHVIDGHFGLQNFCSILFAINTSYILHILLCFLYYYSIDLLNKIAQCVWMKKCIYGARRET